MCLVLDMALEEHWYPREKGLKIEVISICIEFKVKVRIDESSGGKREKNPLKELNIGEGLYLRHTRRVRSYNRSKHNRLREKGKNRNHRV